MKFADALKAANVERSPDARLFSVGLVCGCTAHHLQTFLVAHLRALMPDRRVVVSTGLFGDCLGNLGRFGQMDLDAVAVLLEWSDLDPRLGLRQAWGWAARDLPDIVDSVRAQTNRFRVELDRAAARCPIALCLPTLPLAPLAVTPGWQLSDFEGEVRGVLAATAAEWSRLPQLRIVNPQRLDRDSPLSDRFDIRAELLFGFPYRPPHASVLAESLARLLSVRAPKKGLITDLDNTLWKGTVGESGADGVSWDLDRHSHAHALYQQCLRSLSDAGVLIAAASKNDPDPVEHVFHRTDILLPRGRVFPLEANWGPKSESVRRILRSWNISAASAVFIDDSPIELAEVSAAHPGIEVLSFQGQQESDVYELIGRLRDLFGKDAIFEEDRERLDSLRSLAGIMDADAAPGSVRDEFLQALDAKLTVSMSKVPPDPRALELVNKTNQFNLNGRRHAEGEWRARLRHPDSFLVLVSYRDKFGSLGTIAVMSGYQHAGVPARVDVWVMSCRAFSRRIEHRCLQVLFEHLEAHEIEFDFAGTPANSPLREFLAQMSGTVPVPGLRLGRERFAENCPSLFQRVDTPSHA